MKAPLHRRRLTRARLIATLAAGLLLLLIICIVVLHFGPQVIAPGDLLATLFTRADDSSLGAIIFDLRLPRIVLAISAGGALACTGVLFQALLRNPLAEPYILGVANGCAVGAIIGYMIGLSGMFQPLFAFAGGGVAVAAVLAISRGSFGVRSESMLLGGVMVGAIGAALIFLLLHFLGPQLRSAIQWMLGDLSSIGTEVGYGSAGLFVVILVASFLSGDLLNAVALGDEEAATLGVNVPRTRAIAYVIGSVFVGASVAFCGAIGFVGLVVPHILRRTFGPDHRALLPLSVIGGAIFLVICDTIARTLMPAIDSTASELPVGAITALVGAPLFIYLLRRGGREGGE